MAGRRVMFASCCLAVTLAGGAGLNAQTSPVGLPEVTPKFLKLNADTPVTVTARVDDPGVISVMLQEVDSNGKFIQNLGAMNDNGPGLNGKGPDLRAGDHIYSTRVMLKVTDKDKPLPHLDQYIRTSSWNAP